MWRKLQDTGIWRRLLCPYVCPRLFSYANVFGEHGPLHLIELICIHTRVVNTCCNTIPIYYKHEQSCCIYGLNTVYPWHEFQFKNYKLRWLIELKSTASIVLVQRFLKNHQWFIISKQCASAWVIYVNKLQKLKKAQNHLRQYSETILFAIHIFYQKCQIKKLVKKMKKTFFIIQCLSFPIDFL